ncbi:unnamed protein product [Tuber aestivum]|uniref:Uncharacterized protein n=1 Tax=Tuber aestivum TaxID=59557 RepID=A0A292Q0I5_9PEZI|nr:unnamed protein product [Tuber aestivum]
MDRYISIAEAECTGIFVTSKYPTRFIQRTPVSPVMSPQNLSLARRLSRFLTPNTPKSASPSRLSAEKAYCYVPSNAAASFLASTTPVTLEERYHQKLTAGTPRAAPVKTLSERSEEMRRFGRSRSGAITIGFTTAA